MQLILLSHNLNVLKIDPKPFDPRAELRDYFRAHLTGGWWGERADLRPVQFVSSCTPRRGEAESGSVTGNPCPDPSHTAAC